MDRIRILFVDDEAIVREGLKKCIDWEVNGFEVVGAAENGEKALEYLGQLSVNIVVTDIKMPVMDGLELIRNSRESGYDSKFLILSGYDDFQYAQRALRYGADDYITKPFNILEVKARIKAIIRRNRRKTPAVQEEPKVIVSGSMRLDIDAKRLYIDEKEIRLTVKEFDILKLLAENPGKIYSREQLLTLIWGTKYPGDARTVDVNVRRLREKIEENPAKPEYVHTKWGMGYYFQG